jgi:hypothetical protein
MTSCGFEALRLGGGPGGFTVEQCAALPIALWGGRAQGAQVTPGTWCPSLEVSFLPRALPEAMEEAEQLLQPPHLIWGGREKGGRATPAVLSPDCAP